MKRSIFYHSSSGRAFVVYVISSAKHCATAPSYLNVYLCVIRPMSSRMALRRPKTMIIYSVPPRTYRSFRRIRSRVRNTIIWLASSTRVRRIHSPGNVYSRCDCWWLVEKREYYVCERVVSFFLSRFSSMGIRFNVLFRVNFFFSF